MSPGVQPSMDTSHGRTRTPRMAHTIKPGEGVLAWQAYKDRQQQDLLHRTEYLTSLVSGISEVEVPAGEDLHSTLFSSMVPDVVCVASSALGRCHMKDGATWRRMVLSPEKRRFPRMAWPQEALTQAANLTQMASSAIETHRPAWQVERQVSEVHPEDRDGLSAVQLQGHQALQDSCWHMTRTLEAQSRGPGPVRQSKAQHRIHTNLLKVKAVPGLHLEALQEDHLSTEAARQQRQQSTCKVVFSQVDKADGLDIATPEMRFSRFFTALMYHGPPETTASHLIRLVGMDSGSTFKFSILDGGKCVRREERLPRKTMPPAMVGSVEPAPVLSSGHYFEVKVMSLFQSVSAADRPKICETYGRTAGVVLGFKGARPSGEDELAKDISTVANSWCISSNGWFFSQRGRPNPQLHRPTSQMRATPELRPTWHRARQAASHGAQLRCVWPPLCKGPGHVERQFDWSCALQEGDTLGLLAMPSGALVLTVNGVRELMVADAGVLADQYLYPIVQVANHVRSVKLCAAVEPPE